MQLKIRRLGLFLTVALIAGCTDSRVETFPVEVAPRAGGIRGLTPIASVHFDGSTTETQQMLVKGSTLFLSGKPFGFSIWDISSNPTQPYMQFAFKGNINNFLGGWTPDDYASGAIGILGNYVLTSGVSGASLIDTTDKNNARELYRYPNTPQGLGAQFDYKAIIPHPTQPYFYGFRSNDYVYMLQLGSNGIDHLDAKPYQPGARGTCCVLGGASFQGNAFVAFRSSLREFSLGNDGAISQVAEYPNYNATNVVSTTNYLFVQHQAIPGNTGSSGIYIFDANRQPRAYLPITPVRFAVSQDNQYFYANLDNDSVTVFRINWSELIGSMPQ